MNRAGRTIGQIRIPVVELSLNRIACVATAKRVRGSMPRLTKMVEIPKPAVGNVTIVISDSTGYMSVEVTREELVQDGAMQEALNYLDAEIISIDIPSTRLQQAMEDVVEFRDGND